MKRKRNPERADRENPIWTKETFSRARKAREVLPEIFGKQAAAKMLKPRGRPKTGNARTSISLRLPPRSSRITQSGAGPPAHRESHFTTIDVNAASSALRSASLRLTLSSWSCANSRVALQVAAPSCICDNSARTSSMEKSKSRHRLMKARRRASS